MFKFQFRKVSRLSEAVFKRYCFYDDRLALPTRHYEKVAVTVFQTFFYSVIKI